MYRAVVLLALCAVCEGALPYLGMNMPLPKKPPVFNKGEVYVGGKRVERIHSPPTELGTAWGFQLTSGTVHIVCPADHDRIPCFLWANIKVEGLALSTCVSNLYFKKLLAGETVDYTSTTEHSVYTLTSTDQGEPCPGAVVHDEL